MSEERHVQLALNHPSQDVRLKTEGGGPQISSEVSDQPWNRCPRGCDAFDCQFPIKSALPLTELGYLGHGREGIVKKVLTRHKKQMALKVIRWSSRQKDLLRIQEEVRLLRTLRHPHIVELRGSYIEGKTFYGLLMHPAAECDLGVYLDRLTEEQQSTSLTELVTESRRVLWASFGCLASALAFLHANRVKHKDIKPRNILVHNGEVFFTDFGIAKSFSDASRSGSTGPTACTRRYAAPEILEDLGIPHGRAADVFALGCVFVEVLTVLARKAIEEFIEFVNDESDLLSQNVGLIHEWLDQLALNFTSPVQAFLNRVKEMVMQDPIQRPTASDIFAQLQKSVATEDALCGSCCCRPGQITLDSTEHDEERIKEPQFHFSTDALILIPNTLSFEPWQAPPQESGLNMQQAASAHTALAQPAPSYHPATFHGGSTHRMPQNLPRKARDRIGRLSPEARAIAQAMRKVRACWRCRLLKERCDPSEICNRCVQTSDRHHPGADNAHGLFPCLRKPLWELVSVFRPTLLEHRFDIETLPESYENIPMDPKSHWPCEPLALDLTWGHGPLIQIRDNVCEVKVKKTSLLRRVMYTVNPSTGMPERRIVLAPPLAIKEFDTKDYVGRFSDILEGALATEAEFFSENYGRCADISLRTDVLALVLKWFNASDEIESGKESNSLKSALTLIVATHVMGSTLVIPRESHDKTMRQLQSYQPGRYKELVPPSILNRQLMAVFCLVQKNLMVSVLKNINHLLRSRHSLEWIRVFVNMAALSIALEDIQQLMFLVEAENEQESSMAENKSGSVLRACQAIDEQFQFLVKLSVLAFGKWRQILHDQGLRTRLFGPGPNSSLFGNLAIVIESNYNEMVERSKTNVSEDDVSALRCRLLARFLLAMWE